MPESGVYREGEVGRLEWWRVVALDPALTRQMHFIDEGTADEFARRLVGEEAGLVVLEYWCAGWRMDYRLVVTPKQG